jgi:hypothetical protein
MSSEVKLSGDAAGRIILQGNDTITTDQTFTFPDTGGEVVTTPTGGSVVGFQQGIWTPILSQGTASTVVCAWSRIGNTVTLAANLKGFSDTSSANNIQITGIPYARNGQFVVGAIRTSHLNYGEGSSPHVALNTSDIIRVGVSTPSIGGTAAPAADYVNYSNFISAQASNTQLVFSFTYYTDDTTWTPINGATVS